MTFGGFVRSERRCVSLPQSISNARMLECSNARMLECACCKHSRALDFAIDDSGPWLVVGWNGRSAAWQLRRCTTILSLPRTHPHLSGSALQSTSAIRSCSILPAVRLLSERREKAKSSGWKLQIRQRRQLAGCPAIASRLD